MNLVLDEKRISKLDHKKIIRFIENNGWNKIGDIKNVAEIWQHQEDKLVIPTTRSLGDYRQRIYEAIVFLSKEYEISPARLVDSLDHRSESISRLKYYSSIDLVKFRIIGKDTGDGTIPISKAVKTIEGIHQTIYSAARSTVDPRAYYVNRGSKSVEEFMRGIRLGQTSVGSYVFNVISPVDMPKKEVLLEAITFERRVIERIYNSLSIIEEINEDKLDINNIRTIYSIVSNGLSANLCEGLNQTSNDGENVIEISFDWGENPPKNKRGKFRIDSEVRNTLTNVYEVLRQAANLDEQKIRGGVESLQRKRGENTGKVGIATLVEGRPAHIYINLDREDYDRAVAAHNNNLNVSFFGKLVKNGNRYSVENPRSFVVDDVRRLL